MPRKKLGGGHGTVYKYNITCSTILGVCNYQNDLELLSSTHTCKKRLQSHRFGIGQIAKEVNTVSEVVPVWLPVRYISSTGQYQCTVSGLPLFYIFNIYISIYIYITNNKCEFLFN